jgi:hypothetical protein
MKKRVQKSGQKIQKNEIQRDNATGSYRSDRSYNRRIDIEEFSSTKKQYSDYLINGIPIWQIENRGMTKEESDAYQEEVIRLGRNTRTISTRVL